MGFNLAGTDLVSSSGLAVMSGATAFLQLTSTGLFRRHTMQPMFRAGNSGTSASPQYGTTAWVAINFNATNVNVGNCFDTVNRRFTAPVAGMYLFSATVYHTGAAAGFAIHGMFWVNGASNGRRPGGPMHRLYTHGVAAGYAGDNNSTETIFLFAGDYVEFRNNSNDAANTLVPQYSHFEGYLLG